MFASPQLSFARSRRLPTRRTRALLTIVVLVGALLGTTLATGQGASARTGTHSRTSHEARMSTSVLHLINAQRRAHHLKPLHSSKALRRSARRHDATMSRFDLMSHQLPHESYFASRIRSAGYHWSWAGENIGTNSRMTTGGVRQLQKLMYHEQAPNDGHRQNILNGHYRNVGVDVYVDHVHHRVWLTTDFGRH